MARECGPVFEWRIIETAAESERRTTWQCNARAASIEAQMADWAATVHRMTRDARVTDLGSQPARMIICQSRLSPLLLQRKTMDPKVPRTKGMLPKITKTPHVPILLRRDGGTLGSWLILPESTGRGKEGELLE